MAVEYVVHALKIVQHAQIAIHVKSAKAHFSCKVRIVSRLA